MFEVRKAMPLVGAAALAATLIATPAQASGDQTGAAMSGLSPAKCKTKALIKNGSFEKPKLGAGTAWALYDEDDVQAWMTNDPADKVEIWSNTMGVQPKDGVQLLELNATGKGNSIYQDIRTAPGTRVYWEMYIRARDTTGAADFDTTQIHFGATPPMNSGGVNGVGSIFSYANSASEIQWKRLYGWYKIASGQKWTRVTVTALSSATNANGYGNLVDNVRVWSQSC